MTYHLQPASLLRIVLFADDSNLVIRSKDPTTLSNIMTAELANISDWFSANRLLLNPYKTKLIVFWINESIKYYDRTCKVPYNLSRKLGMMSKMKNFVSKATLKMVYNCFVQPHLIYGIQLWGATFKKGLSRIQKLQKKAIRLLTGANKMDHSEPRLKSLEILKLDNLYKLHTAWLVYDCFNGDAPAQLQGLFSYVADGSRTSTRSQSNKPLDIKATKITNKPGLVLGSRFISKGPDLWNNLHEKLRSSAHKEAL
jgi:hypothetical protein